MYFYALPVYKQARRVGWEPLRRLIPDSWIKKESISDLRIVTHFNSELWVVGLDKPQRVEGDQWDGGTIDEASDVRPGTFGRSILPALSHKYGWCRRIGVPKRFGIGANEFKAACMQADGVDSLYFNWPSTDILTPDQIRWARENLDERDFREQYMASWETASGLIFYAFDSVANVDKEVLYDPTRPLIVGSDFNVDPMCWVLCQWQGEELWVIDELFIRNTNTQYTLDALHKRYGSHPAGWEFYGDATSRARKTSASVSDYIQIRNDSRFLGRRGVFYPQANPSRRDRFAACNALLCNASGVRRCKVHPRCKRLIADLENRAYLEGTTDPNDSGDIGHMSDAWGYVVYMTSRLKVQSSSAPTVLVR